jgi:hypothetical protein
VSGCTITHNIRRELLVDIPVGYAEPMRSRSRSTRSSRRASEETETTENQGSFNVFCLALSLGGNSVTEPCQGSAGQGGSRRST